MALQPTKLILHRVNPLCSSAKVRIAACLKSIPLTIRTYELNGPDRRQFKATIPGLVRFPTLEVIYPNGESSYISHSLAMLDFLDETYPDTMQLTPPVTDMIARFQAREIAAKVSIYMQPQRNSRMSLLVGKQGIKRFWRRNDKLYVGLHTIDKMITTSAGTFSVGDRISIADVCLVPMVQEARRLGIWRGLQNIFRTVHKVFDKCEQLEAFQPKVETEKLHPPYKNFDLTIEGFVSKEGKVVLPTGWRDN